MREIKGAGQAGEPAPDDDHVEMHSPN
jgi:hypothetical protein